MAVQIGLMLFPGLTQLDLTGPYEVFSGMPGAEVHLIWKDLAPVRSENGLQIVPSITMTDCPQLDVLCVPGGPGQVDMMEDAEFLDFLRRQGEAAKFVTSVCTGALLLGAAGLLDGYRATTYWACTDLLDAYGATFEKGRVVRDRNRFTGGGVTAGIDFALTVVAALAGEETATAIQLSIEYNPAPPFESGHPDVADPKTVDALRTLMSPRLTRRVEQAERSRALR